jgi:hypothetical protein
MDKEVKIDKKGKGKEPPLGMGNEKGDMMMLLKVRKWVHQRLEDFEAGELVMFELSQN